MIDERALSEEAEEKTKSLRVWAIRKAREPRLGARSQPKRRRCDAGKLSPGEKGIVLRARRMRSSMAIKQMLNFRLVVRKTAMELIKLKERLSRKGIEVTGEQLEEAIMKFAIEREGELEKILKEKKSNQMLKGWLETPVKVEKTDAVKEHDTVV